MLLKNAPSCCCLLVILVAIFCSRVGAFDYPEVWRNQSEVEDYFGTEVSVFQSIVSSVSN